MKNIHKIELGKFTWHNITDNEEDEIRYLRDEFKFDRSDVLDVANPPLRPKIEFLGDYVFIILLFPIYHRKTQSITSTEVDMFLGKDYLVTVHKNDVNALRDISQHMENKSDVRDRFRNSSPLILALHILEESMVSLYPMLNHISWDIDNIDSEMFNNRERELIHRILSIKRNIVDIRKAMMSHKNVIKDLYQISKTYYRGNKQDTVFNDLIMHTRDIWDQLENHKVTIDALQETNESLITFRLNDIMKTLTIFSVTVFPLTLLAAIFGMNTVDAMPFMDSAFGFWKVIAIMVAGTMYMFYWFKKHKWI